MKTFIKVIKASCLNFINNWIMFVLLAFISGFINFCLGLWMFAIGSGFIITDLIRWDWSSLTAVFGQILPAIVLIGVINVLLSFWFTLAIFYAAKDKTYTPKEVLTLALKRFLPALFLVIIVALIITGGTILFIIPGIILGVYLFLALPILLFEKVDIIEALKRSFALTKGYWWKIFGLLILFYFLVAGVWALVSLLKFDLAVGTLLDFVLGILYSIFYPVFSYSLYREIKNLKGETI